MGGGKKLHPTPSYHLMLQGEVGKATLFVNQSRLSEDVSRGLSAGCPGPLCVTIEEYEQVSVSLRRYAQQDSVRVWIGTEYTTLGLYREIPQEKCLEEDYSPVMITKAVKNSKEQELLRAAHVRDAVAVIRYLVWLEKTVPTGSVDEISGAHYVDQLRREELYCHGPSFETISASGLNAALAHYSPSNTTSRKLAMDEMYLLDSGGQYLDGTTDITRTVHWGEPTAFQKEAYTRVLMGNIDLSRLVFPPRTSGFSTAGLETRLKINLPKHWETQKPSKTLSLSFSLCLSPLFSPEPGYYEDGEFGIRLEDIAVVVEAQTKVVSLVPYARNLIDVSLMSQEQIQYINSYYESIRKHISPELQRRHLDEEYQWLQQNTQPLSHSSLMTASLGTLAMGTLASTLLPGA
ncbi:hypothetical protein JD844_004483 [Phrynosoma platyrhinos]|uniref:Xaa-Pro aminopeptidase 2 n=1 Tax=Phrynosoma platyrhinos TaxID=52577 RepID=A0ABQ7TMI3_PHRPL|nr:hypothetical protein JD844_004483 [Phrynosoma platyrhinos]